MGVLQRKKQPMPALHEREKPGLEQTVRRQLAGAAGAEQFQNRDPVHHVTEEFQRTFDLMGAHRARELGAMRDGTRMPEPVPGLEEEAQPTGEQMQPQEGQSQPGQEEYGRRERGEMDRMVEPSPAPWDRMFLGRFSQVAFQRGVMAGAVLRGQRQNDAVFLPQADGGAVPTGQPAAASAV